MSALVYNIRKSLKNGFLEVLHKPAKLVMWLLVIVFIVGIIIFSLFNVADLEQSPPMFWLAAAIFAFIALFMVISLRQGLTSGDAIFEMQDVNLMFVSPTNPRLILLYGIVRMTKTAFLAGFFILFQANTLKLFGVDVGGMFVLFGCFMLAMIVMMTASLLIYSICNGRPVRKRVVRALLLLIFVPLLAYFGYLYLGGADMLTAAQAAIESPCLNFVPIAGWSTAATMAFFSGDILAGLGYLGLDLLLLAGMITFIMLSNPDYFEDVLVATETAFEKKRAALEGDINTVMDGQSTKKIKVRSTGISGSGASAIFAKQMRENFRANRFGIVSLGTVIFIVGSIIMCAIIRDLSIVLQIMMWVQIVMIGTGRGLKELYTHYIYMIPVSSFKKIIWNNMEVMAQAVVVACAVFIIGGLIAQSPVQIILACIAAFVGFSFMLLGINYLQMRFTGASISQGMLILIYYIMIIVAVVPGVVAAMLVGFAIGGVTGLFVGLMILSGWELLIGLVSFALSARVLDNCDMPSMRMGR